MFRTQPHATMDSVGAAHYLKDKLGDISAYAGINQNYAWGQDSWNDFVLAMKSSTRGRGRAPSCFPSCSPGETAPRSRPC